MQPTLTSPTAEAAQPNPGVPPQRRARHGSPKAARPRAGTSRTQARPPRAADAQAVLRKVFGLQRLRPAQEAIVQRVLDGRNTLGVLPTGAGKSLCYQLPALLMPGRTVVVSPLIALMKDQCDHLRAHGVPVAQVNSALPAAEVAQARQAIADGTARIVMTTPEQLADPEFSALLGASPVSLLAVDEAHCIAQWGHDFRPAFLDIQHAVGRLGKPVVLALTATANAAVMEEVMSQLGIAPSGVVQTSSYRPNLNFHVEQVGAEADKLAQALRIVGASAGNGIIYTSTVRAAEQLHEALLAGGESAGLYHGKLPAAARKGAQDAFMSGATRVMVATNAFGLGIDKPDIRFVLHYQLPPSLDAYYQEAGRAGRDGEPADCTLLYLRKDKAVQQFFMAGRYPGPQDIDAVYHCVPARGEPARTAEDVVTLADRSGEKARVALSLLRRHGIVSVDREGRVCRKREVMEPAEFEALLGEYQQRREQDHAVLEAMVAYAQSGSCRWHALLTHLDEDLGDNLQAVASQPRCGHCDSCARLAAVQVAVAADPAPAGTLTADAKAPASPVTFTSDDDVMVRRYGRGKVVSVDASGVTVAFPGGEKRTFLADFVRRAGRAKPARRAAPAEAAAPA